MWSLSCQPLGKLRLLASHSAHGEEHELRLAWKMVGWHCQPVVFVGRRERMLVTGRQTCCHSNLACLGGLSGSDRGSRAEDPHHSWVWFPVFPIRGSSFFVAESLVQWVTFVCSGVSLPTSSPRLTLFLSPRSSSPLCGDLHF